MNRKNAAGKILVVKISGPIVNKSEAKTVITVNQISKIRNYYG
jgi:hypothetical protein